MWGGAEWHVGEQVIPNWVCCFPQMKAAAVGLKVTVSNVVFTATQHNKMPQHLCGGGEWHAGEQVIPNGVCCFPQMQAAAVGLKVTASNGLHCNTAQYMPIVVSFGHCVAVRPLLTGVTTGGRVYIECSPMELSCSPTCVQK